jgi:hypothetical protein
MRQVKEAIFRRVAVEAANFVWSQASWQVESEVIEKLPMSLSELPGIIDMINAGISV